MSLRRLIACTQRVAFAALTVLALLPATVRAADAGRERTLSPYFVVERAEAGVDALPLKSTAVEVRICRRHRRRQGRQRYAMKVSGRSRARYVFPHRPVRRSTR
jgi:Ca-activated chloride channel family protein